MNHPLSKLLLLVSLVGLLARPLAAADEKPSAAQTQFQRAYYLETHEHDLAAAAIAYEHVLADPTTPAPIAAEAKTRLTRVREDLAAVDFARLMPSDVMGYAELAEPGKHVGRILKMMGLIAPPGEREPSKEPPIPLGEGLFLPADFTVSPALAAELEKIRGAAAGITAIDDRGRPSGLLVIHPGDCDLLRGAIETGVQLLEPGEAIEGFKTYRIRDLGWVTLTARLVLVSDSREGLTAAIGRLRDPKADSLASQPRFQRVRQPAAGSLVFAYVDGPQAMKRLMPIIQRSDERIIRGVLDLEHVESLTASVTTRDDAIAARVQLNLMEGHKNLAYALIRTAPLSKRSLSQVPAGSAAVLVLGLNPPGPAAGQQPAGVSAMDVGRELFHNIDELAVFALPTTDSAQQAKGLPEIGVAVAVKDPAKSEAVWNQVLGLASLFGARESSPPSEIKIEGRDGHTYHLAGMPTIAVVRSGETGLVIGTPGAVAASLKAVADKRSIADDPAFAPMVARLTPTTSKALFVNVGGTMQMVTGMSKGREAQELQAISQLVRDMKVSITTDEAPNQLTIDAEVTGLPKFHDMLPLIRGNQGRRGVAAR